MASETSKQQPNNYHLEDLRQTYTAGGHPEDRSQPGLPIVHRKFANPAPLGLLAFATGMFLISSFGIHARGIHTANLMISVLIFFGGICQYIVGAMEFITGNTFGFTVFTSYGAFNMSYSMIYLPGSGIVAAYTDKETGQLTSEFQQSVALYLWVWFILTVIFTMAAMRSSWVLVLLFAFLDICLMLLAIGNMINNQKCLLAGYGIGYIVTLFSYWAGVAGLFSGATPFNIPTFSLAKED